MFESVADEEVACPKRSCDIVQCVCANSRELCFNNASTKEEEMTLSGDLVRRGKLVTKWIVTVTRAVLPFREFIPN